LGRRFLPLPKRERPRIFSSCCGTKEGCAALKRSKGTGFLLLFLFGFATAYFLFSRWDELTATGRLFFSDGESFGSAFGYFLNRLPDLIREYSSAFLWAYALFIAGVIFLEEKNPDRTIAWILVLILLPVLGFVLYLFFGPDIRGRGYFRRLKRKKRRIRQEGTPPPGGNRGNVIGTPERKTALLLSKSAGALLTTGNSVRMLLNGEETFSAITDALSLAEKYIHVEYYSIANDTIGNTIKDILIRKAREGVRVNVIFDSVGSWDLGARYIVSLKNAGVRVHSFLPVSFPRLRRELNFRNHRKIVVVDGTVGFMGGLNIGDMYISGDPAIGFWRDTHIRLTGPAVSSLDDIFRADWAFCDKKPLAELTPADFPPAGEAPVQIVASGPDNNWKSILQGYFSLITNAGKSIWLCTPYFVPGDSLATALTVAAMSGVDVRVMIPHKTDHALVYWASLSHVEELLKAGVKVYRYEKGFIHSKILIADGSAVSVGTANFDARSLEINFEVQAFIYDASVAGDFIRAYENDLEGSSQFRLHEWLRRPFRQKVLESAGRLWSSQI
jgi:cardiolipin synthase